MPRGVAGTTFIVLKVGLLASARSLCGGSRVGTSEWLGILPQVIGTKLLLLDIDVKIVQRDEEYLREDP